MQPWRGAEQPDVFYALQLDSLCGLPPPPAAAPPPRRRSAAADAAAAGSEGSIWVHPTAGDDAAAGAERSPMRTVHAAVAKARALRSTSGGGARTVVLKAGIHFLGANGTLGTSTCGRVPARRRLALAPRAAPACCARAPSVSSFFPGAAFDSRTTQRANHTDRPATRCRTQAHSSSGSRTRG